jgi:hypothetical protein
MKELTIPAFGDDLHRVILGNGPIEFVSKGFADD